MDENAVTNANDTPYDPAFVRIDSRISKLEAELRQKISDTIEQRLDRDRSFLKEVIGAGLKVLGSALGVIVVILAIFGIKTISDVQSAIHNAAITEVKSKLDSDNPNSPFRQDVARIVNRALLNSYLVTLARQKDGRGDGQSLELDVGSVDRLLSMLSDQDLADSQFEETVSVLSATTRFDRAGTQGLRRRVTAALSDLLSANSNSSSAWIARQTTKRVSILRGFRDRELLGPARNLLGANNASELRIASAIYIADLNDQESIKKLEDIAGSEESPQLKKAALLSIARLVPDHRLVRDTIARLERGPSVNFGYLDGMELASALYRGSDRVRRFDDRGQVGSEDIRRLLKVAFDAGVTLEVDTIPFRSSEGGLKARLQTTPGSYRVSEDLNTQLFLADSNGAVTALLRSAASDLPRLWKYIKALSVSDTFAEQTFTRIKASDEGKGSIKLTNGTVLTMAKIRSGFVLTPLPTKPARIQVEWLDELDNRRSGDLALFEGLSSVAFTVTHTKSFKFETQNDEGF